MDPEEYRKKIELDILTIIEEKLLNGQMDIQRAKTIARMVLDKLRPHLTLEQIFQVVPTLDDHFAELSKAVSPVIKDHDEMVKKIIAEYAEKLIKSGKFADAKLLMAQEIKRQTNIK